MVSKSLSTSEKRAALHKTAGKLAEFCQALYPLLIAHADDWGRLPGDEFTVKHLIDPSSPRKLPDFVAALHLLHEVGLIDWYHTDGKKVIEICQFSEHQDLKGHTASRTPKLPPCPDQSAWIGRRVGGIWGNVGGNGCREVKRTEVKGTEVNQTAHPRVEGASECFERFWGAYPRKTGKDAARRAFTRLHPGNDLTAHLIAAVEQQRQSAQWQKDGGQFIPHPATWLNQGRWLDEPIDVATTLADGCDPALEMVRELERKRQA
jgi:hypothetical protein